MSERKTKITCTVQEKKADGGNFSRRKKKLKTGGGNCQKLSLKHKNPMKANPGEIYWSSEIFNQQIHRKRFKRKMKCC